MPARLRHRQRHRVTAELQQLMGPSDHFTVGKLTHCSCPQQRFWFVGLGIYNVNQGMKELLLALAYFGSLGKNRHFTIVLAMKNSQYLFSAESLVSLSPGRHPPGLTLVRVQTMR